MARERDLDEEALLGLVDELAETVSAHEHLMTSRVIDGPRQVAAAALARGCDLAADAVLLLRGRRLTGVGLLARGAWESWLAGTFALHGGLRAYLWMVSEEIRQQRVLCGRNDVDATAMLDERQAAVDAVERQRRDNEGMPADPGPIQWNRLSIEAMAAEAGVAREAATKDPSDISGAYDLFYRSHSAFDSHGLQALERRIREVDDRLELQAETPWLSPIAAVSIAALYLSMLAIEVFKVFGIASADLEEVQQRFVDQLSPVNEQAAEDLVGLVRRLGLVDE